MEANMFTVTNDRGDSFNVVVVLEGDSYGLDDCLTHEKSDPLVEFYDAEYANQKSWDYRGQFIGRYYLSTLTRKPVTCGLDLMGYEPKWKISKQNFIDSVEYAKRFIKEETRLRNS
jgi:hypothetical protein